MTVRGHLGRSLAVGGALAVLGAGVGMTLTDRALGVAPPAPAGVTDGAPIQQSSQGAQNNKPIGPFAGTVTTSTITVPAGAGVVRDVDVFTNITHTAPGDLDIELVSPSGRVVKMIAAPPFTAARGTDAAFANALWDDSGQTLASDGPYPASIALVPEGAFGAFVGLPASGTWTLRVTDTLDDPPGDPPPDPPPPDPDGGTLVGWQLRLATQDAAPALTTTNHASTAAPQGIPDNSTGGVSSTISVSGAKGYLWDVNLRTNIDHNQTDDLLVRVTHLPSGRSTDISTRSSRPFPFFQNRLFDDSATALVTRGDSDGTVIPEGALSAFMGVDPNGQWRLDVFDLATGDTGTLNGWSLDIKSTDGVGSTPGPGPGPAPSPGPGTPPAGGTIGAANVCLPVTATASKPSGDSSGRVEVSVRQLQINQRIFQAAVRRANAIQAWLDAGVVEGDICGGAISAAKLGPGITTGTLAQAQSLTPPSPRPVTPARGRARGDVKFELTAAQFLINQRVAQAAVRRANGLQNRLDSGLTGGDVRDGAISQGKLNAGLAILSAQPSGQPQAATKTVIAEGSGGDPGKVKVDAAQLLISQRIGQAAIRRLNALTARLQAGLRTGDFKDASLSAADLSPDLRK